MRLLIDHSSRARLGTDLHRHAVDHINRTIVSQGLTDPDFDLKQSFAASWETISNHLLEVRFKLPANQVSRLKVDTVARFLAERLAIPTMWVGRPSP